MRCNEPADNMETIVPASIPASWVQKDWPIPAFPNFLRARGGTI